MTLFFLAYLGGILSVLSPCILPVVPFVFARGDRPFLRSGAPLLIGMTVTFAAAATLAAVAGEWAIAAGQYGRYAAIAMLGLFALALLSERVAQVLARPFVRLGDRLHSSFGRVPRSDVAASLLVGVATGLLWAPCAGPVLGLVLTGATLQGAGLATTLALLAYGAGAATALAVVLLAGMGVLGFLKQRLGLGLWVRRGLGAAVLAGVAAVATGADGDLLEKVTFADTTPIEQWLVDHAGLHGVTPAAGDRGSASATDARAFGAPTQEDAWRKWLVPASFTLDDSSAAPLGAAVSRTAGDLPVERRLPGFGGAVKWLNSPPLSPEALRGKVVLVQFWTYACINCRHVLPYVKAWDAKYRSAGLVVVGVHTPELAFEKVTSNVEDAVRRYGITYPVAIDLNSSIWNAYGNRFWPANYFADAQGRIRYHHAGEGDYAGQERVIQDLLRETGASNVPTGLVTVGAASSEEEWADVR